MVFMGLIMGEALCNGLWLVIYYFTGKIGNAVFIPGCPIFLDIAGG